MLFYCIVATLESFLNKHIVSMCLEPSEGSECHVELFDLCCAVFYFKQEVCTVN